MNNTQYGWEYAGTLYSWEYACDVQVGDMIEHDGSPCEVTAVLERDSGWSVFELAGCKQDVEYAPDAFVAVAC